MPPRDPPSPGGAGGRGGRNRLVVLRHAKATHKPGFRDVDRPLTHRGERDAAAAGRFLRGRDIAPDRVLCSSSLRTRQTWDHLAEAAGQPVAAAEVTYDRAVYEAATDEDLIEIIQATPAGVGTLLVIGHNPAAADLVASLTGDPTLDLPTSALAVIGLAAPWPRAAAGAGRLEMFWTPGG